MSCFQKKNGNGQNASNARKASEGASWDSRMAENRGERIMAMKSWRTTDLDLTTTPPRNEALAASTHAKIGESSIEMTSPKATISPSDSFEAISTAIVSLQIPNKSGSKQFVALPASKTPIAASSSGIGSFYHQNAWNGFARTLNPSASHSPPPNTSATALKSTPEEATVPVASTPGSKPGNDATTPNFRSQHPAYMGSWRSSDDTGKARIAVSTPTYSKTYVELIEESPGPIPKSQRPQTATRPIAKEWSLLPGSVVWLPENRDPGTEIYCIRDGHCQQELLNDTGYNHPGVILGCHSDLVEGKEVKYCSIAQLRTYNMTDPKKYVGLRYKAQQFTESFPIRQAKKDDHEDLFGDINPLELKRGYLHNQTYVQLQHIFRVPVELLMVFHHGSTLASDVRLTEDAYRRLMKLFGCEPQPITVPTYPREELKRTYEPIVMQGSFGGNWERAGRHGRRGGRRSSCA